MRCAWDLTCPDRSRGLRHGADGVYVCLACGEMTRSGHRITLDEFTRIAPPYQQEIGLLRQSICEALGLYDHLKAQGVQLLRG